MNEQTRFAILVGGIAVVVVGLWWLLWRPAPSPRESTVPSSVTERERDDTPREVSAPAGRREARPSQRITGGAVGTRRESLTGEDQIAGTPQSGIGTVKGEVLWADSKARVEGAEVIAEIQDYHEGEKPPTVSARWRTVTGPDGKFLIERLPEFRALLDQNVYYRLYARTDDAFGESGFQLTDDEPSAYEKIELYPAGTISGRVINAEGQPVANAWLSPHRYRPEGSGRDTWPPSSSHAVSDEAGLFTLANLRPGEWAFITRSPDYVPAVSDFAEVGSEDLTVTLERGMAVSGIVVNVDGEAPVPNIAVSLNPVNHEMYHLYAKGKSGADGTFSIANVAAGEFNAYIQDDTHVLVGSPPTLRVEQGRDTPGIRLPVAVGGAVTGRAYDVDTGEPLENVVIRSRHGGGHEARTDIDGNYRLEGLSEGLNRIGRRWKEGYLHGEEREDKEVMVRLGEVVTGIDFPMKKGLRVRGKVVDSQGNPIEFADVQSQPTNDSGEGESTETLADGAFEHRGYSPNTQVTIVASKDGYQTAQTGPVTINDADVEGVEIVLETGASVHGEVVDPQGNPMPDISVTAQGDAGASSGDTDAYGRFRIEGLGPGVYQLSMQDYGRGGGNTRVANVQRVTVPKGGKVEGIRLIFKPVPGPAIAGRVADRRGMPIAGVEVSANGEEVRDSWGHTRTGDDGRFELTGLKPGRHYVNAYNQDYMHMQEPMLVETGNRNVEIVLVKRGTVEGRVMDARTAQPIKHFRVESRPGLGRAIDAYNWYGGGQAFFDENGEFVLTGVAEGEATLFVQAEGYIPAAQQIPHVDEFTPVRGLVFRLEAGGRIDGLVTDGAGEPVAEAQISIITGTDGGERPPGNSNAARSDSRGRFTIDGVSEDITGLQAWREGFLPADVEVRAGAGRAQDVTIRLSRGGIVQGRVTVNGKPAREQQVVVQDPALGMFRTTRADNDGRYSFSGLPDGEVRVGVNPLPEGADPSRNAEQTAIVEEGNTTVVDFSF